jgi:hypothetical protein
MIRSAHLLCATTFIAACFACAPLPPPPSPPTPSGGPSLVKDATCSDGPFIKHVFPLAANYDPSSLGTPPVNSSGQLTSQEQTDLNNAFIAAPPRFQKALCNLDGIYVDPSNVYSWGLRDIDGGTYRYIGLSQQSLWGSMGQSSPPKYSYSETSLIQRVLATIGAPWPTPTPSPTNTIPTPPTFSAAMYGNTPVDTPAMTVLAALAHEYGHILWFDLVKGSRWNLFYDPAVFCRKDPNKPGDGFFDNSWQTVDQPPDYLEFAKLPPSDKHYNGLILTQDLINAINGQQWSTAANYLNLFYSPDTLNNASNVNGVWPSLFGSISPEEDSSRPLRFTS